jgi:endonuclease YncB( thermonuclease family)
MSEMNQWKSPRMRIPKALFFSIIVLTASSFASLADSVRVVDGDTIELEGITYRLHGIDAPEAGQSCNRSNGKRWPCGKQAITALEDLVSAGGIACDDRGADGYGRTIGVCTSNGQDLNALMVSAGMAWAFTKYSTDYVELERKAKAKRIGVWQADTTTPWDYRAERWAIAEQEAPSGCPIKGNISDGGHIYHAPWSPWYTKTKVSTNQGERWFCSEAEAVAAGWRAPFWGRKG